MTETAPDRRSLTSRAAMTLAKVCYLGAAFFLRAMAAILYPILWPILDRIAYPLAKLIWKLFMKLSRGTQAVILIAAMLVALMWLYLTSRFELSARLNVGGRLEWSTDVELFKGSTNGGDDLERL